MSRLDASRRSLLALALHFGFGSPVPVRLFTAYGDLAEIWEETPFSLSFRTGLREERAGFLSRREALMERVERLQDDAKRSGIGMLFYPEPDYPPLLKHIHAPPVLFFRGEPAFLHQDCLGVVGTRHATPEGMHRAWRLAAAAVRDGIAVVSGAARGIDGAAHSGALDSTGGRTAAVLASGVDVVYPARHARLLEQISEQGVLLSEFPPKTEPRRAYFPMRNRLISGLCARVVVVEAPARSGALITAQTALEQGREVTVCLWERDSPHNAGTRRLYEEGAAEYREGEQRVKSGAPLAGSDPVLRILSGGPRTLNGLLSSLRVSPKKLLPRLSRLQLERQVVVRGGSYWLPQTAPFL